MASMNYMNSKSYNWIYELSANEVFVLADRAATAIRIHGVTERNWRVIKLVAFLVAHVDLITSPVAKHTTKYPTCLYHTQLDQKVVQGTACYNGLLHL